MSLARCVRSFSKVHKTPEAQFANLSYNDLRQMADGLGVEVPEALPPCSASQPVTDADGLQLEHVSIIEYETGESIKTTLIPFETVTGRVGLSCWTIT